MPLSQDRPRLTNPGSESRELKRCANFEVKVHVEVCSPLEASTIKIK